MSGIRSAYDFGRNEFAVTGHVPYFRKVEIDFDDLDTNLVYNIPVDAGTIVLGVGVIVTKAFDGNLPILLVGRSGDTDGFLASGDVALATLNSFYYSGGGDNDDAEGHYSADADYIVVDVDYTTTAPTYGTIVVLIHELKIADNWRSLGDIGQGDIASME